MKITCYCILLISFLAPPLSAQQAVEVEPALVFVEGGDFSMGCTTEQYSQCISDEKPAVRVQLPDFWIGKYEVTNAQYAEFLTQAGNQMEGNAAWYSINKYALIDEIEEGVYQPRQGFEDYPVTNVSWYGAKAYTTWLSTQTNQCYRLPTEAEWEYAARGGQKSESYVFCGSDVLEEVAWFSDFAADSKTGWSFKLDKGTHPVGQKKPNELGLHDMSGNVSEWCEDVYENRYEAGIDPTGPKYGSLRVLRGGSWDNRADACRVSARNFSQHVSRFSVNKGFRVVMEKDISTQINDYAREKDFQGTILIQKENRTIYEGSFGLADRENNTLNTSDTKFRIASITKLFTSVIILQLAEEGKLDLDRDISHYLPAYKGPGRDEVTIHHLLTHTSGIQNCEDKRTDEADLPDVYLDEVSTDELLQKYCSGDQITAPGLVFDYDNGEYIILGKIIEAIDNDSYQEVLQRQILAPLQMDDSGLISNSNTAKDVAQSYKWESETNAFVKDPERRYQNYYAAGAMYSTASDLMKFSNALYQGELLNNNSLALMMTTYPQTPSYGYGLWVRYAQYNSTVAKVGQRFGRIWGVNTLLSHFVDHDITVIVLANTDKVYVSDIQHRVGELLLK